MGGVANVASTVDGTYFAFFCGWFAPAILDGVYCILYMKCSINMADIADSLHVELRASYCHDIGQTACGLVLQGMPHVSCTPSQVAQR